MLRLPEYLEAWGAARKAADPTWTWVQAAAELGVTDTATVNWRRGVSLPPRARTERLVQMVGDPGLLSLIEADRATMAAMRRESRAAMPSGSLYPTPRTLVIPKGPSGGAA